MSGPTTTYGTWYNFKGHELTVAATVAAAVGDYDDDYDLDAIEDDYRDAIQKALPGSVGLAGEDFIGPYYEKDQDFDGYPEGEFGGLDITAIIESVDLMAIVERHEQWTIDQVADHLGYKTATRNATARKKLSSWGVKATAHKPHPDSGRVQARYNAREVENAHKSRPGQGRRSDREEPDGQR
ncbi:hypothetical protein ACFRCX_30620 [Streptomyces sp. NPDC056652]|uniref:hypothetical protein n=1 Tax=Streptomyces sp. NPDC056652 TaxID=3345893 RepID=UPI0036BD1E91